MSGLSLGAPHHIRFTVTDVARSQRFYQDVLNLQVVADAAPPEDHPHHKEIADTLQGGVILTNGSMLIGLRPVDAAHSGDAFDPFRVGLDHVSFSLDSREALDAAAAKLDELGVPHGEVAVLESFQLAFVAFFDPDGIALEFTAPIA